MADRGERKGATPQGGARSRPDERRARLTGDLPGEQAFMAEFPGGDLLSVMATRALERVAGSINMGIAQVWREHGVSHAAGNALSVIEGVGRPMTPGEISEAMHTTSGSITSLIDTLVKKGLVHRMDHADDRRKVLVDITEAGQDLLDSALPSVVLLARDQQAGLTDAERRRLFDLLEKLHDSIAAVDLTNLPTGTRHRPDRLTREG